MKMTSYTVEMDSGEVLRFPSRSAAEAMQQALSKAPGAKVVNCHSGLTLEQARACDGIPGLIYYEIPDHEPVDPIQEKALKAARKAPDKTGLMFTEAEMSGS